MDGADMIMTGWRYILKVVDVGKYTHSSRFTVDIRKFPKERSNKMDANWTTIMSKILLSKFELWMNKLEALHLITILDIWCRIGHDSF